MTQEAVFRRPESGNVCNSERLSEKRDQVTQAAFGRVLWFLVAWAHAAGVNFLISVILADGKRVNKSSRSPETRRGRSDGYAEFALERTGMRHKLQGIEQEKRRKVIAEVAQFKSRICQMMARLLAMGALFSAAHGCHATRKGDQARGQVGGPQPERTWERQSNLPAKSGLEKPNRPPARRSCLRPP